jgi:hypothetical protein
MSTLTTRAAVGVSSVLLCAVSGCSGSAAGPSPQTVIQAALKAANNANTVGFAGTLQASGAPVPVSGRMRFNPARTAMTLSVSGPGTPGPETEIYDGRNYYLQASQLTARDNGKQWAQVSARGLGPLAGTLHSLPAAVNAEPPTTTLTLLLACTDLADLGSATVSSTPATHYAGTLTAAAAATLAPGHGLDAAQVLEVKQQLQLDAATSERIEEWIGPGDLPLKEQIQTTGPTGTTTTTLILTAWGAPVAITEPPFYQVAPLTR